MNKVFCILYSVLFVLWASAIQTPTVHAEYDNIRQTTVGAAKSTGTVAASGTFTTVAFTPLPKTTAQSAMITGTGTSPNYKVEILVSIDGTTFVKPETGGDLGTFTDQESHIVAINVPLSIAHKFKTTELGGANSIVVVTQEACQ